MPLVIHDVDKSPSLAKVLVAAGYAGVEVEVKAVAPGQQKSKQFLADFPLGRLPSAKTNEGSNISGLNTILRYVAQANGASLYGGDANERAQVDQWLEWTILDIDLPGAAWLYPIKGIIQNNPGATNKAKGDIRKALEVLNAHLATRTFLVGQRISLADIAVALSFLDLYTTVLDTPFRKQYSHANRWFNTCIHQPHFAKVLGEVQLCAKMAVAPEGEKKEEKKEAKPKAEKKPEAKPKAEKKPEPKEEPEEDYSDKPKGKNPLDSLPPSKFNLEEWKRQYSNTDTRSEAIPWLWQNYDPEGFSMWFVNYKDHKDLEKTYMVANMLGGWLQRCDPLRKYGFGAFLITGGEGPPANFTVEGLWIFRGKEIPQEMLDTPDVDSYEFKRADIVADKALVEDYLAWGEPAGEIQGRKVNQGKNFK